MILNAICYYNINGKYCHMTNKQFAKLAKCTERYVMKMLNHTLKPYIIIGREEGRARGPRKQRITLRRIYTSENKSKYLFNSKNKIKLNSEINNYDLKTWINDSIEYFYAYI